MSAPENSKVKIEVNYARDLYDTEMFGKMDPYVKVRLGQKKKFKTDVKKDVGRNPTFYETTKLRYDNEAEILFEVWDKDTFSSDDFVGSAKVSMASIVKHGRWQGDLILYRDGAHKAGTLNVTIKLETPSASNTASSTPTTTPTVVAHATAVPVTSHQPVMATVVSTNTSSYGSAQPVMATAVPAMASYGQPMHGGGAGAPAVVNATVIGTAPAGSFRGPVIQGRVIQGGGSVGVGGGASAPPPPSTHQQQPPIYNNNFTTNNYQAPLGSDGQPLVQVQSSSHQQQQQQQYYNTPPPPAAACQQYTGGPPPPNQGYNPANFATSNFQSPPGPDGQPVVYVQQPGAYPHY